MNRRDKAGMGVPSSVLQKLHWTLGGADPESCGEPKGAAPTPRSPSAPSIPGTSSACAICPLGSHPRHSQALSQEPGSFAAAQVQVPAFPPISGGSGSAWREGGWPAELLFVVLVLKCRIITKATGSQSSSPPAQNSNDKSAKNSGHFSSCSTGPSRLPSNLVDPRPTTTAFKYPK